MGNTENSSTRISKLGTIDCDLVETTPFAFRGRPYRLEGVRSRYAGNTMGEDYLRIVEREGGEVLSEFGRGYYFPCAHVEGENAYVFATDKEAQRSVAMFVSRDLVEWNLGRVIHLPRYRIFNTSVCRDEEGYIMMFEIDTPREEGGVPFTARFAFSKDLEEWEVSPPECNYSLDRYTAPHCLRHHDGWYYNFFLEAVDGAYEQCVVRSRDLIDWEASPLNPVLSASKEDRLLYNTDLTPRERERIETAENCNNSDIDLCELGGRVIINYSWGNQRGIEHLAEAVYEGTLAEFLTGWFPGG